MTLIPSLLVSFFLIASPCLAAPASGDDGQYYPVSQAATTTTAAAITAAPAAPIQTYTGTGDWATAVTWPAGCESWANPCPPGAPIAGGGVAGGAHTATDKPQGTGSTAPYENGFTSYTTMTDANGVITGMPPKATIPAGVTASTLVTSVKSSGNYSLTSIGSKTGTQTGFGFSTSTQPASANSASQNAAGGAALFVALGLASLW